MSGAQITKKDLENALLANNAILFKALQKLGTDLRQEMHTLGTDLRQEMQTMASELRQESQAMGSELREEIQTLGTDLRTEMQALGTDLRQEMQTLGTDLRQEFKHEIQAYNVVLLKAMQVMLDVHTEQVIKPLIRTIVRKEFATLQAKLVSELNNTINNFIAGTEGRLEEIEYDISKNKQDIVHMKRLAHVTIREPTIA